MSDGIFSPMLRDLLIFVCLTVSILAFVFAAYAWTMMQDGQKKYVRMQSFMDEYDKMKERMKDVETRLRKEEIKLKATMAANRLGKAGLIPSLKDEEAMDVEALEKLEKAVEKAEAEATAEKLSEEEAAAVTKEVPDDKTPWQAMVDEFNGLAANMNQPRYKQACENFVDKYHLAMLAFTEIDKMTEQPKFVVIGDILQSSLWAMTIEGSGPGKYAVVPNPIKAYNPEAHDHQGMKETFASNFERGTTYTGYQVKLPAIFKAMLGNWRIERPGVIRLS